MHFKIQGSFNCDGNDALERNAPSDADLDDEPVRDGFHLEFDNADSESSENDVELPYNVEAFVNPVYNIEDLNIVDPDDIIDSNTNTGEENEDPLDILNEFNFTDQEGSSSSSEMSGDYDENEWEIVEPNKEQQDAPKNRERENLNSTQQGTSHNLNTEDKNDAQQGALINQEITTTNNDIERTNLNCSQQSASQNSENEDSNNAQQGALSNEEISTTNDMERKNSNSTQQDANYNSDNEDLNSAQQGSLCNQEINTTNDIEKENLNSTQQSELCNSDKEDLNFDVLQGASSNLEINTSNDINPNLFNDNCTNWVFITCDDECIEPIAISTPSFGTYSPYIYYGPQNSGFETPEAPASVKANYRSPSNSGHPSPGYSSPYPPDNSIQADAGNILRSSASCSVDYESSENTTTPSVSNTTFSSTHHALGNPGYATLHLLPRNTFLHKPRYSPSHYHFCPVGRCYPGPYSPIFTDPNNRTYRELHSVNFYGPGYPGYTDPRLANYRAPNNHGYFSLPAPFDPTHNNASYITTQTYSYDASSNLVSGTQSTNYIASSASADGTADASAYEAPNASGYDTSTSFVQTDQLLPGQGASITPAYLDPHSYDYGNPYSPNYIASISSSGTTHYSPFSVSSSGYPGLEYTDTLDVFENAASQSPVTQVLSNDKASGSKAPYNYGGPGISGYIAPARHEPIRNNANEGTPQGSSYDASDHLASGTTQPTNYITSSASADGNEDAYEAPNASSYNISTSFDQSDQYSLRQGTSEPLAYLGLHAYDYHNECPPNYSSSDATHYSQYSAPSYSCPDTLDVSENVTSQLPVTQIISSDEVSSSTASYNYGDPSTSGYGTPASNEPTYTNASYRTPQAHDTSDNLDSVTTGDRRPGWLFFSVYGGPNLIRYNFPNSTGYDASSMSGDSELGPSGGQRGRRHPFNSRSQSRSIPNPIRRHGRGRGDKHGQ